MSELAVQTFNVINFYKGYLPLKEQQRAQSYAILALPVEKSALPYDEDTFLMGSVAGGSMANSVCAGGDATTSPSVHPSPAVLLHPKELNGSLTDSPPLRDISLGDMALASVERSNDSFPTTPSSRPATSPASLAFYLYRKKDIEPPPIRFFVSPKKVHRCFLACEKPNCRCDCAHVRPGTWRTRLDTIKRASLTVARAGQHVRIPSSAIIPTAGYFLALGLRQASVVPAVVPTMCRFNSKCKNGAACLFIHATDTAQRDEQQTASISLRTWGQKAALECLSTEECLEFFSFLEDDGIQNVGDLQVLGIPAYENLARRVPPQWAEAFYTLSVLRTLDTKMPLTDALLTFPRIVTPVNLPPFLGRVGDLLHLPSRDFYSLDLPPHTVDACELIRLRLETDDEYNVIDLKREEKDSFFSRITDRIAGFRGTHAHCSWRKHDPTRPVVTSVLTYVDVNTCRCHLGDVRESETGGELLDLQLPAADAEEFGFPSSSWCRCPRHGVIAVNYELSTPSGSRCSEQNAMGKLASLGVPTWAVREVFVHGMNSKKEANPLFPCGVCENMLQKVTKDVLAHYGGDVTLYMFDATKPRKLVYLPIPEISHRDGSSFKKFVNQDLREH